MSESPLHILDSQPCEDRLLPDPHAVLQAGDLCINRFDLLVFFAQFAADLLVRLPVLNMPLVQRLDTLQDRFALFSRFVRLTPFFFNLVLQLL